MKKLVRITGMMERKRFAQCFAFLFMFAMLLTVSPASNATLATNITGIVDDLTTFFGSIQTLVIAVVVFGLAISYAKLMRKK